MRSRRFFATLGSLLALGCGGSADLSATVGAAQDGPLPVLAVDSPRPEPVMLFADAEPDETPITVPLAEPIVADGDGISDPVDTEPPPATADDTDTPVEAPPDPDHELIEQLSGAGDVAEQTALQEQVIEQQVEQAEDLNDELARILEKLRREKGLPPKDPYVAPSEVAAQEQLQQVQAPEKVVAPEVLQRQEEEQQTSAAAEGEAPEPKE